jgi:hypothetical protein
LQKLIHEYNQAIISSVFYRNCSFDVIQKGHLLSSFNYTVSIRRLYARYLLNANQQQPVKATLLLFEKEKSLIIFFLYYFDIISQYLSRKNTLTARIFRKLQHDIHFVILRRFLQ